MSERECQKNSSLIKKDYLRIEQLVVDLYDELGICVIPIDPFYIARRLGYVLKPYSKLKKKTSGALRQQEIVGTSLLKEGVFYIFYDDSHTRERQGFTIMHEIGHIQLGHKEDSYYAEKCANYFAAYALAPSPLIGIMRCEDFLDVATIFGLSPQSGQYSFDRYIRWISIPGKLKPYEERLMTFFR